MKCVRPFVTALVLSSIAAVASAAPSAARREVMGIQLGSSLKEAKAGLTKLKIKAEETPGYIKGLPSGGTYTAYLRGSNLLVISSSPTQSDYIQLSFSPLPENRVVRISRKSDFDSNNQMTVAALKESLDGKYGRSMYKDNNALSMWAWSPSGEALAFQKMRPECIYIGRNLAKLTEDGYDEQYTRRASFLIEGAKRMRACGIGLYVTVDYTGQDVVKTLQVDVLDVDATLTGVEQGAAMMIKQESAQNAKALQDAKGRKPNL